MKPAVIWTEERKLFRSVTETTSLIAWATDESGQCYYLSPAWYQFTGAKEGEGLGFNWLTSVHPNDVVSVRRAFFEANDNRTAIGSAFRMADANGDYFLVWDVGLPKFSDDLQFQGFFGTTCILTPDLLEKAVTPERLPKSTCPDLTPREREILRLISYGNTTENVAAMLQITGRTVDTHVTNAGLKLGSFNRAHTVATAIRLNAI